MIANFITGVEFNCKEATQDTTSRYTSHLTNTAA